jgi:tetratricopeptide (TPR) repeat protein
VSERVNYPSSPAIRTIGQKVLGQADRTINDIDYFDLYSCFPSAVQIACAELGIAEDDPRGLTVTGGLPYFGGAGNNYVMHSIATMAERLAANPGQRGLITANGGYLTKHSFGVYGTEAPTHEFRWEDVQAEDDQEAAVAALRKAADTQDTIPYMEPPFWYYPVRQSLGAALLKTGHPEEAEKEFRAALERERSSAWALYGLKEAAKAKGNMAAEQKAADELAKAWRGDPSLLTLERL